MKPLFRIHRHCTFSLELRQRQILRGLGIIGIGTLGLAAHLQHMGRLPEIDFLTTATSSALIQPQITTLPTQSSAAVTQISLPKKTAASAILPSHWTLQTGSLKGSFATSAHRAGLTHAEITSLTHILGNKIDFNHLKNGTSFKVISERIPATAHQKAQDSIVAAEITTNKTNTSVLRYNIGKQTNYYQFDGSSLSPGFLRYPTHYTRIGSGFMLHRLDPVTGKYHSHPAIDFDAPMGTPITATGDGKIATMNFEQGYGNVVRIDHPGHVLTLYAHMRNFAQGLHAGSTVKKGQVIGYVGMTGYATGPHVHYELHFGAKPVNPLTTKLPAASGVPSSEKTRFNRQVNQIKALLG